MQKNFSPWIHQLDQDRPSVSLGADEKTDIAIIGAGIAGVSTAFFLLKHTSMRVTLIEGYKLAHGATGHNAGQIAGYFEKPFRDIVAEFGLEMACEGQKSIDNAWMLLDEMYTEAGLDIHLSSVTGYAGLSSKEQVFGHLENDLFRRKGGLRSHPIEIYEEADFLHEIPEKYHNLFGLISREEIALKLETFDPQYCAVLSAKKGVTNSALFCQEVVSYLQEKYRGRFSLYEHTRIGKVVLKEDKVLLDALKHTVECDKVVLCTNGFDNFEIFASSGLSIDTRFHYNINGVVAFMASYLENHTDTSSVVSYFPKVTDDLSKSPGEPYFYVTRRPYDFEKQAKHTLTSIGGPDFMLDDKTTYDRDSEFSEEAQKQITGFVYRTYDKKKDLDYAFMWHGVMGYTKNLLRMIGQDPEHNRLYYNLGCNGVGILASIFGGDRIARMVAGEEFPPSIFDITKRI